MGATYLFKCTNCDYEVESSGKRDRGFFAIVEPYICNKCNNVTDVLIGRISIDDSEDVIKDDKEKVIKNILDKHKKALEKLS